MIEQYVSRRTRITSWPFSSPSRFTNRCLVLLKFIDRSLLPYFFIYRTRCYLNHNLLLFIISKTDWRVKAWAIIAGKYNSEIPVDLSTIFYFDRFLHTNTYVPAHARGIKRMSRTKRYAYISFCTYCLLDVQVFLGCVLVSVTLLILSGAIVSNNLFLGLRQGERSKERVVTVLKTIGGLRKRKKETEGRVTVTSFVGVGDYAFFGKYLIFTVPFET